MDFQRHDASDFVSKMRMERRKAQKPRIEKLRRDRINGSLEEIKRLVLEALNKDSSRYSKMEKADILEMTVQFLKGAQARKRLQIGLRSQAENTMEIRTEPKTSQIPGLKENPLLAGMSNDITPIPMLPPSMPPFVAPPMVTMGTQPAIVWLSCPSPPPSLAKEEKQTSHSSIKQSINTVESGNHLISRPCGITTVTSPSNVMFSVWRPW